MGKFIMQRWGERMRKIKMEWERVFDILGYIMQRDAFDVISG